MDETEQQLSTLIGDIYDAALDPQLWPHVLGKARDFVVGAAAALYSLDAANNKGGGVYYDEGGIKPRYIELYFEKYGKLNPTTTPHIFADVDEPVATVDLMAYDEFLQSRFYREWARPQALVDHISVTLEKATMSAVFFGVFRHERHGLADDETRRRMRLLSPHIRRAVLIGKVIDIRRTEAAILSDSLDQLSAGMFLVSADAAIVHANAAGHVMLGASDFLHVADGRLTARDIEANRDLREAFASARDGDAAVGVSGIAVPLVARDGDRYVAHVLPLTGGLRQRAGSAYRASAAVFVHRAALQAPSPPEVIAKTYKLTPTELRILFAVVEMGGAPEISEALGIAETTIKTHLGRLYQKTGTRRHADLVKLVAGFSNPLVW